MLFDDINAARECARYEIIEDDEPYYAEIPKVKGVWATGKNLEECRRNLAAALKGHVLFSVPRQ
ncbi:MAG: type II toxin-antitoxin system HicB family antitoxin [Acidobacteria bacterium]|nr:MAG: type II toxin-antitoxin system HicB family antitoxin [Acidobacteriota bacterium]